MILVPQRASYIQGISSNCRDGQILTKKNQPPEELLLWFLFTGMECLSSGLLLICHLNNNKNFILAFRRSLSGCNRALAWRMAGYSLSITNIAHAFLSFTTIIGLNQIDLAALNDWSSCMRVARCTTWETGLFVGLMGSVLRSERHRSSRKCLWFI